MEQLGEHGIQTFYRHALCLTSEDWQVLLCIYHYLFNEIRRQVKFFSISMPL